MLSQDPLRAINDFYDGLYIYRLLQAEHERSIKAGRHLIPSRNAGSLRNDWQLFLDDICLLCDTRRGGQTTIAIAVEVRKRRHIFWAATQAKNKLRLKQHISSLLQTVQCSARASVDDVAPFEEAVLITAVRQSAPRVHNYANKLESATRDVQQSSTFHSIVEGENGPPLIRALANLQKLLSARRNHAKLCMEAHAFCSTSSFEFICQMCNEDRYDGFCQIRHYAGRLGAWYRASKNIVSLARSFPRIWRRHEVRVLPTPSASRSHSAVLHENLEETLCRVLPHFRSSPIFDDALQRLQQAEATTLQPRKLDLRPHVESVMLSHFRAPRRQFAHMDAYIGCSKPSCYCCQAYFALDGSGIRAGRSHGNIWMTWCLPQLNYRNELTAQELGVLRKMTDSLNNDICNVLVPNGMAKVALFESTTGLSLSAKLDIAQSSISGLQ